MSKVLGSTLIMRNSRFQVWLAKIYFGDRFVTLFALCNPYIIVEWKRWAWRWGNCLWETGGFRAELERLSEEKARDLVISKVVRCRVGYFVERAVIGSKAFVDGVFRASREWLGPK